MEKSDAWGQRVLYTFLIGKNRSDQTRLEEIEIMRCLEDLFSQLKKLLGGLTRMRVFEAGGATTEWDSEQTAVVFVLAEIEKTEEADMHVSIQARKMASALAQDEVWITRQELELYIGTRLV